MAFARRPVRLVGGDARPSEERTSGQRNRRGVGLIGPNGVLKSALTSDQKVEIESRIRVKWDHERDSGILERGMMRTGKKVKGSKKGRKKRQKN